MFKASILPKFIFSVAEIELYNPITVTSSALLIVLAMQTLMFFQAKEQNSKNKKQGNEVALTTILDALSENISHNNEYVDPDLLAGMAKLINEQKLYLQTNLKIVDFAQALQVPEYKISRAIRDHYKVANFNLFINQYRVKYAKTLLAGQQGKEWSILSIALESGFSSLATFNRVFKSIVGDIPNEYRKQSSN